MAREADFDLVAKQGFAQIGVPQSAVGIKMPQQRDPWGDVCVSLSKRNQDRISTFSEYSGRLLFDSFAQSTLLFRNGSHCT